MQIVIDVPDNETLIGWYTHFDGVNQYHNAKTLGEPNYILLPKGHGRLIDADELKKIIQENDVLNMTGFNVRVCDINATPTIIEADRSET